MEVVDGGDLGCGELLLVLAARSRVLARGSTVRLLATDPAAPIDLPAWCHLTGHTYLGQGLTAEGRPHFDVRLSQSPRSTSNAQPWRRDPDPDPPSNHHREEHP